MVVNKVLLMGRLTKDPDVRQNNDTKVARYTIAVGNDEHTDFINCVCFKGNADFAEKYLTKGIKIFVEGSIRTGSYINKEGQKVYTTDVIVTGHAFCEPKGNGFSSIDAPVEVDDAPEELPFL